MSEALDNISCPIAPVADSHLANKAYVDAAVANGAGTASGPEGDTVSIPAHSLISCGLEPTDDAHLVNKAYVDAAVAAGGGGAAPVEEPAALGFVVYVTTLSDAPSHSGISLRDAITMVTQNSSLVIKFSVSGTITLEQGEIVIPVGNIAIDGEDKITISGGGVSRVFALTNAYAILSLHRLTLTGGNAAGTSNNLKVGGAVYVGSNSALMARGVTFTGNSINSTIDGAGGGAVSIGNGRAGFVDCVFSNNSVVTTGANGYGGALYSAVFIDVVRCVFTGNSCAGATNSHGGAVYTSLGTFRDCEFTENTIPSGTAKRGGGCFIYFGSATFYRCTFTGNDVGNSSNNSTGGGLCVYYGIYFRAVDCEFSENIGFYGAGIYFYGVAARQHYAEITRCKFDNNAGSSGGRGAAIYSYYNTVKVEDCEFKNHALGTANGVIYAYGYTNKPFSVTVNRCKFTGNSTSATTTGLIYCANLSDVYIYNSVFTGNSAATAGVNVALLYTTGTSTITAGNLTMTNNEKFRSFRAASGTIKIYNSVDVGNVAVPTMTNVTAISPLTNWSYGTDRIAYDSTKPLFAADGYTPVANSQVIDKGDNTYAVTEYDLVGKARVSGTKVDLGAVEYQQGS